MHLVWECADNLYFNPFVSNAPFLYPLKKSENLTVFWCFQRVEKRCIGNNGLNINSCQCLCNLFRESRTDGSLIPTELLTPCLQHLCYFDFHEWNIQVRKKRYQLTSSFLALFGSSGCICNWKLFLSARALKSK